MKVAIPIDKDELIDQHFGHAERFRIYALDGENIVGTEDIGTEGTGHEALAAFFLQRGVDALVCGGIGSGAVDALGMTGIRIYGGIRGLADFAAEALARGMLAYNPQANCDHHHEEGSCGCGHHEDGGECGCGCH